MKTCTCNDVIYGRLNNVNCDCTNSDPESCDKHYTYTQRIPSDEWSIVHNLNKYPSVTVVDSGGSVVVGETVYIDNNNIQITFSSAFSGKAYCN